MAIESLFTLGKIYNATEGELTSGRHHDWHGGYKSKPYPENLAPGKNCWFVHLGSVAVAPPARAAPLAWSSGAIIYRGQTTDKNEFDWIVAWDNQINSPHKVYTSVSQPIQSPVNWDPILQNLINSTNESTSANYGFVANVSIGDGNFPVLRAVLSPQLPATNQAAIWH